ncbi:MAG: hypothetical protein ABH877_04385 [bacterium]
MSYLPQGITEEERADAMLDLRRREVLLQEKAYTEKQSGKFWRYLSTFATVGLPVLTFLGFREYFAAKRRRERKTP